MCSAIAAEAPLLESGIPKPELPEVPEPEFDLEPGQKFPHRVEPGSRTSMTRGADGRLHGYQTSIRKPGLDKGEPTTIAIVVGQSRIHSPITTHLNGLLDRAKIRLGRRPSMVRSMAPSQVTRSVKNDNLSRQVHDPRFSGLTAAGSVLHPSRDVTAKPLLRPRSDMEDRLLRCLVVWPWRAQCRRLQEALP